MPDMFAELRTPDQQAARARAVMAQHNASVRRDRQTGNAKTVAIGLLAVGLMWTVYNNNRLATKVFNRDTVYAVMQPDGEFVDSVRYNEVVPVGTQEQNIRSALWTYVQARDCYGDSSFIRQAYIAQAMSDQFVGRQVHNQFALVNPDAPQNVYGKHNITVQCALVDPPTEIGTNNNQYLFRFRRWEDDGHPVNIAAAPIYTATVTYRTGIYPTTDKRRAWLDSNTFNPPGVQVIDYPGAKPENAEPVAPASPGERGQ